MSGLMSGSRCGRSASSYVEPKVRQGKGKRGLGTVQCVALLALKLLPYDVCALVRVNPSRRRRDPKGQGGGHPKSRAAGSGDGVIRLKPRRKASRSIA
jgi:hypothetical protein